MNTYYLLRHGETFATKTMVHYEPGEANFKTPILEEGKPAIQRIGKFLKTKHISKFYTSEFLRAVQTAEIVEDYLSVQSIKDPLLNEFEVYKERFDDVLKRIHTFKQKLDKESGNIAICSHAHILAGLKYLLSGKQFGTEEAQDHLLPGNLLVIQQGSIEAVNFRD